MDFIRPAARAHWFEHDDDYDPAMTSNDPWEMSGPPEQKPVTGHPADGLIPHPSPSGAVPATDQEAWRFWMDGGWDE